MPTTRKKVIKTVYKDEDDSEAERAAGDFSDSGSDAQISEYSSSDEEAGSDDSLEEFDKKSKKITPKAKTVRKPKFATEFISKINKQISVSNENETVVAPALFSVKDLTEADKLLPTFLNLSESDSSEDESPKPQKKPQNNPLISNETNDSVSDDEEHTEYKDVWSNIMPDNSEEVAKKTFMELEQHKSMIEEAKASILNYASKPKSDGESDVKDLLALGEDVPALPSPAPVNKVRKTKKRKDSDSEVEDWEEVKEARTIPQQGLQLVVDFPDATYRKTKKLDLEMMMKRRINRVKKEYQVYMHKVHVLCWLGHGNYVSRVLNDQEVLAAALSLVPSKECYPGERVDMKYVEQITTWYKDKLILKQDKNEDKFRPKAPPLKEILLGQIKSRVVTTRKYLIYIFISMLRALGLQCRVMLNFVALPIKPPSTELCSLSTKPKDSKINCSKEKEGNCKEKHKNKISTKSKTKTKISQVDGSYDFSSCDEDFGNIVQVDGNDDMLAATSRNTRATRAKKKFTTSTDGNDDILAVKSRNTKATGAKKFFTTSRDGNEDTLAAKSGNSRITRASKNLTTSSSRDGNDDTLAAKSGHSRTSRAKENFTTSRDGNDDTLAAKSGNTRITRAKKILTTSSENQDISPPKRAKKNLSPKSTKIVAKTIETSNNVNTTLPQKRKRDTRSNQGSETELSTQSKEFGNIDESQKQLPELNPRRRRKLLDNDKTLTKDMGENTAKPDNHIEGTPKPTQPTSLRRTRNICKNTSNADDQMGIKPEKNNTKQKSQVTKPKIIITNTDQANTSSKYFDNTQPAKSVKRLSLSRNRSHTATPPATSQTVVIDKHSVTKTKTRTKSAPGSIAFHNKHFNSDMENSENKKKPKSSYSSRKDEASEDKQRVSHKDLRAKTKAISKNDVTSDLVHIIKKRVKEAKEESKRGILKDKTKHESDGDSDYLPEESAKHRNSDSDEDFKPTKLSPKPGPSSRRKIERRVLSSNDATPKNKCDVWCEVFVEELEQWISVDVIKGRVHCTKEIYGSATQPVCYVVGWDNNNYLKEVTRRYVPHWNTVTRKQRAEPAWWDDSVRPWLGPKTARDKEEDEELNRMQLEAPLPKSIAEYKNHPLYALKRHLLKFEAFYPPDAATLGFVRNEPVYARECVHVCRSRDAWLKEAKVVRLGEQPYKLVKPRPRWDKINCKIYTPDEPLEIFGPWQVQDYEPPTAENGIVPRNAYGNVELFKDCMLPKGTVHIKLPGLNRVAKKLNIDCAPAMRGFDPNCGWAHPIYDGFVVCKEFEEIIQEAWAQDQEEQERKEREKIEARVYGNWKRLIKGLLIKQRLKNKYGFKDPTTSQDKKNTGPRLFAKKKS